MIAQLGEQSAETDQLTFIRDITRSNLANYFYYYSVFYLFIYLSIIHSIFFSVFHHSLLFFWGEVFQF